MTYMPAGGSAARDQALTAKIRLRSTEFRKKREDGWRELETFIAKVEKRGIKSLAARELQRLPVLYRSALSSLSVARSIALDRNMLVYLENLTLRAFLVVYGPRTSLMSNIGSFFARGFPSAVRAGGWHILIAALAFAAGIAAGFLLTVADKSWFNALVPSWLAGGRGPEASREYLLEVIFRPWGGFLESFGEMANFLFRHNTMVGLLTFCVGFAAGVPTLLLIVYQGLSTGAFIAIHYNHGLTVPLLGWLSIHGVTEITALLLCGAGGLMIADKILFPGRYSRVESLSTNGHQAAQMVIGAVFMLVVAAILEGGFRQLVSSTELRYLVGGITGLMWLSYFLLGGRGEQR